MIIITPYKSTEYTFEQSKYDIAARLPMRSLIVGPSGTGKSVALRFFKKNIEVAFQEFIYFQLVVTLT